jgi:hypothetical protein
LKDSPVTSLQMVQVGPNSGLFIQQFENKSALNQHEKLMAGIRKSGARAMKMRMTIHDGQVRWSQ